MRLPALALLCACLGATGCRPSPPASQTPATPPVLQPLAPPAGPGSSAPRLSSGDGRLLLSWLEPAAGDTVALRMAALENGAWTPAHTVAAGTDWLVNGADTPSVTALPGGALVAHYLVRGPGAGYGIRVRRSDDGGQTWTAPVTPHRDGTPTEHGFVNLLPWANGNAGVVWLDGRKYAATASVPAAATDARLTVTPAHGGTHGSQAATNETALRFATLAPDGTLGNEAELDARVCDCCQTAAVHTDAGPLIAYRDRSPGEVRDVSVVRAVNGAWSAPRIVHADGWKFDGCPVNGPALAAEGRRVALAWFTMPNADAPGRVLLAFSADAGASFGPPVSFGDGPPRGRVSVVLDGPAQALVAWMEGTGAHATLKLRRVHADGTREPAVVVADRLDAQRTGFPTLARRGSDLVLAWTALDGPSGRTRVHAVHWPTAPAL